jgi:hypothetical protein
MKTYVVRSESVGSVCRDAIGSIYHAALGDRGKHDMFGFLLGDSYTRHFRFALPVAELAAPEDYSRGNLLSRLRQSRSAAGLLAREFETSLLGIFFAWDESGRKDLNEVCGRLADITFECGIQYLLVLPVDGAETLWSERVYDVRQMCAEPLNWQVVSRDSDLPKHNHRRVSARWNELTPAG